MSEIPTIPMLPICSRYTEEWYYELEMHPNFCLLGEAKPYDLDRSKPYNYFTNLEMAIRFEATQILLWMEKAGEPIDKLFLCDLDFPGITAALLPTIRLKYPDLKLYALLHAGSWIEKDIFSESKVKKQFEIASIMACEKVFVATQYHKKKIEDCLGLEFPVRLHVLGGFPFFSAQVREWAHGVSKMKDVLVVGRPEQLDLESVDGIKCDYHLDQISRQKFIRKIASYKIVIIPKVDETFGMIALEAASVGTIPLVPNSFSYFETMPLDFTYSSRDEMEDKIKRALTRPESFPFEKIDLDHYASLFDRIAEIINTDKG